METTLSFVLVSLFATISIAFGFDRGGDYALKAAENRNELQIRLAKLDVLSYLLTSVPLVGGMIILLGSDPTFYRPFQDSR